MDEAWRTHAKFSVNEMIESGNAFLILRKWADEETLLVCRWVAQGASVSLTCFVASVSQDLCTINSRKREAKLCFRIDDPGLLFEYKQRRDVSDSELPEHIAELGALVVIFPLRFTAEEFRLETPSERDTVTLWELDAS